MTTLQEAAQRALIEAATSLETISRLAGKTHYVGDDGERIETYMGHHDQVRGYAQSRAAAAREALAALANEAQAEPVAPEIPQVIKYLLGEDELDGAWFGDQPPEGMRKFWWRKALREVFAVHPAPAEQPGAVGLSEREAFEKWIAKDCGDLTTFGGGKNIHYRNSAVNNAWEGWNARAALASTQPAGPLQALHDEQQRLGLYDEAAPGWRLVPVEATEAMCRAAVVFANGNAVYKSVAMEALAIEESIYGEAYAAMLAAAPVAATQGDKTS